MNKKSHLIGDGKRIIMNILRIVLDIAQVATGFAAILSLFFTIYVYRKQKNDAQLAIASNISSWNIAFTKNKSKDFNDLEDALNGDKINNSNCSNIIMNGNPFPVYNSIVVFVQNNSQDSNLSFQNHQFYYRETLIPGKSITNFINDHALGMGYLVPELYFTDNNNIQWHRSKNGTLEKVDYVDKAVKEGIILKHL